MLKRVGAVLALVVAVGGSAPGVGASNAVDRGLQTNQAYFAVTYVGVGCASARCATAARGSGVTVVAASGRVLFRLVTNSAGRTRTVSVPAGRVLVVVRAKAFRGHQWGPLRFHARSPWVGSQPVKFALKFCLATNVSC